MSEWPEVILNQEGSIAAPAYEAGEPGLSNPGKNWSAGSEAGFSRP